MQTGSRALVTAGLLSAALLASACNDDPSGPDTGENGTANLTLRLTDAPGDVRAAVVTISQIYLQGGGEDGRTIVSDDELTTDLLTLAGTSVIIVNEAEIPAGTYEQLRFVVTGAYLEVEGESGESRFFASSPGYEGLPVGVVPDGELQMPSLAQSGLKVNFDGALVLEGEEDLTIDFDVAESFGREAGNSGRWVMHPVIRGAATAEDPPPPPPEEETASLLVTLALADGVTLPDVNGVPVTLADFQVDLDGQLAAFTPTGEGGAFQVLFESVDPGSVQLSITAAAGLTVTTAPVAPVDLTLAAGEEATITFTITAAELAP